MPSEIYKKIFQRTLTEFVGIFSDDSNTIFKNQEKKLIHPGEYGRYREDACKNVLRLAMDKNANISDGFVISSRDAISTQCDIIVYNSNVAPVVADGIARIFPAEEVRMIVEVKSTLKKCELKDALRKMANNKKMIIEGRSQTGIAQPGRTSKIYDTVGSFLICNNLDFDFTKLDFDEIYAGYDRKYWHNGILGIENAAIIYEIRIKELLDEDKEIFRQCGYGEETAPELQYPMFSTKNNTFNTWPKIIGVDKDDPYRHIKEFFAVMASCNQDIWNYTYDPAEYLGLTMETTLR